MKIERWLFLLLGAAPLLAASPSASQQRATGPHVGYVFPAGARQGTTVDVVVGGQLLGAVNGARITGEGAKVTFVGYDRPMSQREVLLLRDRLDEARKKLEGGNSADRPRVPLRNPRTVAMLAKEAGITDEQLRKLAEFQRLRTDPKRQPNPQIEEKVTLRLQIDPAAAPGVRELRLTTPFAITNPLRFEVGQLPESTEFEPNERAADRINGGVLPATINGQILPGDVDRFTFFATRGQKIVVAVHGRELMPYLADTVPGWFQPVATITNSRGSEIARADHDRFRPDPLLGCVIPADGQYTLEIRDSLYRGREDFVYRVTIGAIPYITAAWPLGGRAGSACAVRLTGWNLPQDHVSADADVAAAVPVFVTRNGVASNAVPFFADSLPEVVEMEPNSDVAHAQKVTAPCTADGRIDKPGDIDVYRIDAREGSELVAEVTARRLGSPLDSLLRILDSRGRQIAANDDSDDRAAGLQTHQADSYLRVKLPAAGAYFIAIGDTQRHGGEEFGYRLRISEPRPDFELRIVPSAVAIRAGTTVNCSVVAIRRDGFTGEIALGLFNSPIGFSARNGRIPTGKDEGTLTLVAPQFARPSPTPLQLEGRATVDGQTITRLAVPADDVTQAFAYHHLVPASEWLVTVTGRLGPLRQAR